MSQTPVHHAAGIRLVTAIVIAAVAAGCVLLDRAEAIYTTGRATIDSITWAKGAPPPGTGPVGEFKLVEGAYDPDSSQDVSRGARAVFKNADGWMLFLERFDDDPREGEIFLDGPGPDTGWAASGGILDGCVAELTTTDFTVALEGTLTCRWLRTYSVRPAGELGRTDMTITFSARTWRAS